MTDIQRYGTGYSGQIVELKQGSFVDYDDHAAIVSALQEQVQKLAAESAGLKDFAWAEAVSYDMEKQDRWMMECNGSRDRYRALETPATDAVIREIGAKAVEDSDDKKRMDWLCSHSVEVRKPQMYGSHAMFHAQEDSEEWDLPHHTTLREQVDAAISAGEQP